jgi:hypothetical protein
MQPDATQFSQLAKAIDSLVQLGFIGSAIALAMLAGKLLAWWDARRKAIRAELKAEQEEAESKATRQMGPQYMWNELTPTGADRATAAITALAVAIEKTTQIQERILATLEKHEQRSEKQHDTILAKLTQIGVK